MMHEETANNQKEMARKIPSQSLHLTQKQVPRHSTKKNKEERGRGIRVIRGSLPRRQRYRFDAFLPRAAPNSSHFLASLLGIGPRMILSMLFRSARSTVGNSSFVELKLKASNLP